MIRITKAKKLNFFYLFLLLVPTLISAEIKLPSIINDNMVLQAGEEVKIWGWANPGEKIAILCSWQKSSISTEANEEGKWMIKIKTPKDKGPYELVIKGENTITIKNIMMGEVWICSGQSNMDFRVKNVINAKKEITTANYPEIRMFTVQRDTSSVPISDCKGSWMVCNPKTVPDFSAVGYFFGRQIHRSLDVAVGLIHSSWGGSTIEAWINKETLKSSPNLLPTLRHFEQVKREYMQSLYKWKRNEKKDKETYPESKVPRLIRYPQKKPYILYNAMIHPLIPYEIRGVIWYQGEANANLGMAEHYKSLFPALIRNWRSKWGKEFSFLFVQLPNFREIQSEPIEESEWALLREAQLFTLKTIPKTGMAITIDIGDKEDIHPKNKKDVGDRLARWALRKTYGKDLPYSGPIYDFMEIKKNKIILHFKHTYGKLKVKEGDSLKGFAISGIERKFKWGSSKIVGNTVVVQSEDVPYPVAVRYGWADNPRCNLYNLKDLPASPFRTDAWTNSFK